MSRLIAALLFLLFTHPHALVGQAAAPATSLQPGARVRITQAGEKPRVAIVVDRTTDTLVVRWPEFSNPISLPISRISRLDVQTGRHRNVLKGMAIGTLGAGAAGFILGAASYQPCTSNCFLAPTSREESGAIGGILLGTVGFVVGTLAGIPSRDTWKRVPLERGGPATVGLKVQGRGLGLALKF